jgi:hypothetical protein
LVLAAVAIVPVPVAGSTSADAWMAAQVVHRTHSTAIGVAAQDLADGGSARDLRELRQLVTTAVAAIDRLEVHGCFRVWWSYVRSSYVLFDQALVGIESSDLAQVQSATAASRYLSAMAAAVPVDCPRDQSVLGAELDLGSRDPLPLADALDLATG